MSDFVHLHVHTDHSVLDGYSNIYNLVQYVAELGQRAVAVTDHGSLAGAYHLIDAAHTAGIKPIIGIEAYKARRTHRDKEKIDRKSNHMLLLAQNMTGYKNLMSMSHIANQDGFYYRPRVDRDILSEYSEGIIATSGCIASEVPGLLEQGKEQEALDAFLWYLDVFGDNFYVELQPNNIHKTVERELVNLANKYNVPMIATTDAHYIRKSDYDVHDTLLCIQTKRKKSDEITSNTLHFPENKFYIMSETEIENYFDDVGYGIISNTASIAEKIELDDIKNTPGLLIPDYITPDSSTPQEFLRRLVDMGREWRYGEGHNDEVSNRIDYELGIINDTGFSSYFLIVWDICEYARRNNIWWNVRGSAAGSVVAYCLGITSVNPLVNNLLFERFLNPDRVAMPDIDLDFEHHRRDELFDYIVNRYGDEYVGAIATFGTLGTKGAFRDVARVYDMDLSEVNKISKEIQSDDFDMSESELISTRYQKDEMFREIWDVAQQLKGVIRTEGVHPAGVLVSPHPLYEIVPTIRLKGNSHKNTKVKQSINFDMNVAEKMGLLKIDFLGLKTLSIMHDVCQAVEDKYDEVWTIDNIPYRHGGDNDAIVDMAMELISAGKTAGVFQVEGVGMTRLLEEMQPYKFEHIVAAIALYRPGPMEYIPTYLRRMRGEEPVEYKHEKLKPILEETYGLIVYQEMLMRIASELFGYSRGEADLIRKAVGKKLEDDLKKHKDNFLDRGPKNGIDIETSEAIWHDYEAFARYGFNKSHSTDYAKLTVQTAVLKAMYPLEYYATLLSTYNDMPDRFDKVLQEVRSAGYELKPPHVNFSDYNFKVDYENDFIYYGLSNIKGVGSNYITAIVEERNLVGPYESLEDFIDRVNLGLVNKSALSALIRIGALDGLGYSRRSMYEYIDEIMDYSKSHHMHRKIQKGQITIFDAVGKKMPVVLDGIVEDNGLEFDDRQKMDWEKELLGMYVSSRPTDMHRDILTDTVTVSIISIMDEDSIIREGYTVRVGGMVVSKKRIVTKNGDPMGFIHIEDWYDSAEQIGLTLFPAQWSAYSGIKEGDVVLVEGRINTYNGYRGLIVDIIELLSGEKQLSEVT